MRSFVQILSTPTADTPGTTMLLHFDNKRYLIGSLAEGTQRACVQMGARLLKVSECFVTGRTEWKNIGGLIGMILTLADSSSSSQTSRIEEALARVRAKAKKMGVLEDLEKMKELEGEATKDAHSKLTLFGPPNLNHTLATARRFVFRKGMPIDIHEIRDDVSVKEQGTECAPYWMDDNVKVWAMSISPDLEHEKTDSKGTISPRKRSIDEVYENVSAGGSPAADGLTHKERDLLTTKAVIAEMFDSSWRLDTLYETPLSQVNLPASIFVRNFETNKIEKYTGPLPGSATPLPDPNLTVLVRRPWPGALVASLPHTEPAKESVSYIIRNHLQRGKFKPERAKSLHVEMGQKWAQLSSGKSVLNENGETITPDMVLGESKEGGGLAVVDLPDPSYINNLINRREWKESKIMTGVGAIVWICGKDVATDPRLRGFMRQFSHLEHIVSSPDCCPNNIALDSAAAATVRLRKVDPRRYTVPVHELSKMKQDGISSLDEGVHVAERGQIVQLEPSMEFQRTQVVKPLVVSDVENDMSQDVLDLAEKAQAASMSIDKDTALWMSSLPDKDAEIVTLGTGSALPSKYRNVSATLLRLPSWGNVLFDCGENTLGQLKRVFSADEFKQILRDLKIIFISHMHADHHLGTVGVIRAWYQEVHGGQPTKAPAPDTEVRHLLSDDQRRLAVISEPAMLHWLSEYAAVEDYGFSHIAPLHISAADLPRNQPSRLNWFTNPIELAGLTKNAKLSRNEASIVVPALLGLVDVQAIAVRHCHGARAVSFTFPSGFKASYSGDCRPSSSFAQIGKGSTVCIHEATFDDELLGDAQAKKHSTTSEALSVAQAMGAKACVLTHFSQRYQKLPVLEHGGDSNGDGKLMTPGLSLSTSDDEEAMDPEVAMNDGPLDDAASTFPDQTTSNGAGQQYNLHSKGAGGSKVDNGSMFASLPEAVKFKLESDMKVCVAFDYMRVKVAEIAQMEKFTPALLKLFAEEDKTEKVETEPPIQGKKKEKMKKNSGGGGRT